MDFDRVIALKEGMTNLTYTSFDIIFKPNITYIMSLINTYDLLLDTSAFVSKEMVH